jgi:hypothetical protein
MSKESDVDLLNKRLLEIANEYIKDCNVFGIVNAKEGGVLELDKLLVDFIPYLDKKL